MAKEASTSTVELEASEDQGFRPEKAHGTFRAVANWLSQRTPAEKLCFLARDVLDSDLERSLRDNGSYEGDIITDLVTTWQDETASLLDDPNADPELKTVAAYLAAVQDTKP